MVLDIYKKNCSGKESVAVKVELNMLSTQIGFVNSHWSSQNTYFALEGNIGREKLIDRGRGAEKAWSEILALK